MENSDFSIGKLIAEKEFFFHYIIKKNKKEIDKEKELEFDQHCFGNCIDIFRSFYSRNLYKKLTKNKKHQKKIIEKIYPELLKYPFNKKSYKEHLEKIKKKYIKYRIRGIVKKNFFKIRRLYE